MRRLPKRADLEQLRRQAKQLKRAAEAGEPAALRRLHAVSKTLTLSAAQLALAREYGFPSWGRLKAEVDHRASTASSSLTSPAVRSWESMREWMSSLLVKRTGKQVGEWNSEIGARRFKHEAALRRWLSGRGVTGYGQTLLVWERFGYPSFMTAGAQDLIGRQYADRPALRPVLDAILARLPDVSPVIVVQARKTYISLVNERRTFAVVQATTRDRVDLGLRLANQSPAGRLKAARGVGNGSMTVKLELRSPAEVDAEAIGWLLRAYAGNQ
jgi:hypothetical protein